MVRYKNKTPSSQAIFPPRFNFSPSFPMPWLPPSSGFAREVGNGDGDCNHYPMVSVCCFFLFTLLPLFQNSSSPWAAVLQDKTCSNTGSSVGCSVNRWTSMVTQATGNVLQYLEYLLPFLSLWSWCLQGYFLCSFSFFFPPHSLLLCGFALH